MLAIFPLALKALRALPSHEYAQAARAPAWFIVVLGGSLSALSLWALGEIARPSSVGGLPSMGDQVFLGLTRVGPPLMADAYTLWSCALLGAALAIGGWVPAARRSMASPLAAPLLAVLAGIAQLMLFSDRIAVTLVCWLLLLAVGGGLWYALFRPRRRWQDLELPLVLLFVALLAGIGLGWLDHLARGDSLRNAYSNLLTAPPGLTNGAVLLLLIAWLGVAIYLPWWAWGRRDEPAMVWLPATLVIALAAQFVLVHLLFLVFPPAGADFAAAADITPLFLIDRALDWMMAWGVLALLVGGGWLTYYRVMRAEITVTQLRPLLLAAGGLLLVGISAGMQAQQTAGAIDGLLWVQLTWAGVVCVWLAAGGMFPALSTREGAERATVQFACWMALAALVALPPGPGFRGLAALWGPLHALEMPRGLVVVSLAVTALAAGAALPRWAARQEPAQPRDGAAWGIIGLFLLAFLLMAVGLAGDYLSATFRLIGRSLIQAF